MATVDAWITYAALRGTTVTPGAAAESALVRASDYIRLRYLVRLRVSPPPETADEAIYIAAAYELARPGYFSRVHEPGKSGKMMTRAADISWTPTRTNRKYDPTLPTVPAIEALFRPYGWVGPAMVVV